MKTRLFIFLFIIISSPLLAQDMVQWRGNNRDGKYQETGLLKQWPAEGPRLLWHFDGLGDGHSSAVVSRDKIFTAGTIDEKGYIFAFSHQGDLLWKSEYGKGWTENWPGTRSTPLIEGDNLYFMSAFGKLICMHTQDGRIVWSKNLLENIEKRNIVWGVTENLAMDGDKLFVTVGGEENNVIAVDKNNGNIIWKNPGKAEKSAYGSPLLVNLPNRKLLIAHTEKSILGFDAHTGALLWSFEHINKYAVHPNVPLYHDGYLYCVSGYGKGGLMLKLAEDGASVSEVWRDENLDNQMGGVILLDGKLYGAGHNNREFFCIDWETGKVLYSTSEMQRGNTIFADDMLYFYDERGWVGLVKPDGANTKLISSFKVPYGENQHWAHLVIADKKLFVRHGTSLMVYSLAR